MAKLHIGQSVSKELAKTSQGAEGNVINVTAWMICVGVELCGKDGSTMKC